MARAARVVRLIGACDGDERFVSVGIERWPSNTCTGVLARLVDLLSGRKMMDGVGLSSRRLFVAFLISSLLLPRGGVSIGVAFYDVLKIIRGLVFSWFYSAGQRAPHELLFAFLRSK